MEKTKSIKKKNTHSTTTKKKAANKKISYKDRYFCTNTWRERPVSKDIILELARDFWQYCFDHAFKEKTRKPISLARWLIKAGLPRGTYNNWNAKYPDFKEIVDEAKEMIGIIHIEGVMMKEFSEKATMYNLHHYSEEWRNSDKYHDERAKQLKPQSEEGKVLQPLMLSADQFREAIKKETQTKKTKDTNE